MATTTATTAASSSTTSSSAAAAAAATKIKVTPRPSAERGFANHGWLYSFHTFSFASYWHPKFQGYGPLRVINEDRVAKGTGFGTHSHAEFLIFSYIVAGELEHKDSLGNLETLRRGDVQFTSAGTGIRHSEYNRNASHDNHFLQIWAKPNVAGLQPQYVTRSFPDELKRDKLCTIMQATSRLPRGDDDSGAGRHDPIPLHADLTMEAAILSPGKVVEHDVVVVVTPGGSGKGDADISDSTAAGTGRKLYAHLVMSGKVTPETGGAKIKIGDTVIAEGDGAFIEGATGTVRIESVGETPAEFILFDMGENEK